MTAQTGDELPRPSARALRAARELLRALSSARQVYALYPTGHPNRLQTVDELADHVEELRRHTAGDPVLFVARRSFYLGPTLMARESLSLFRLVRAFENAGIESVELTSQVRPADLDRLASVLHDEHHPGGPIGGIQVDRIKPKLAGQEALEVQLSDLREAYASGLQHLREQSLRVAADQPVDLEGATDVVQRLADQVVADPAHALLLTTIKSYDEYTYYHMLNVCLLSIALAHAVGLHRDQVIALGIGALLHDVGKVNVPEEILLHVGRLSEEQWRIVQRHPVEGAGLVFSTREGMFHPAAAVVLEHHAAYDLSGYPRLTRRPTPSLPSRLVSVADCFDAVTAKRAYRRATDRRGALEILESGAGRGFDPRFVRIFTRLLGLFPVGSLVRLDTGDVGLVVGNDERLLARPTVLRVLDAAGNPADGEELDLSATRPDGRYRFEVVESLDPDALGVDVMELLATGDLDLAASAAAEAPATGLVHEPSYGESAPEGYVDTHYDTEGAHHHDHHHLEGRPDPDVAPPLEEDGP